MRWLQMLLAALSAAGVLQWWRSGGLLWLEAAFVLLVVTVLIRRAR